MYKRLTYLRSGSLEETLTFVSGECSQEQDQHEDEGSRPGQKKSNSDAAALKASANPMGSSGAGMTLQRCPDLRQGWRVFVLLQ